MENLRILAVALMLAVICSAASAAEFEEDFESYASGSEMHGQGGWAGWDDTPGAGAPTSSAYAFSGSNSVEIIGAADLVHIFDVTGGRWELSAMQYIPSGTTGVSWFILLNTYSHGGTQDWSVQTQFNLATGAITSQYDGSASADIVYDQWVEIKCVINLDENTVDEYYNGEFFSTHQWDNGNKNTLQVIDLYGNGASSIYYDDIVIEEPPEAYDPEPADDAVHAAMWATLRWQPGGGAVSHDMYLGTSFDDVNDRVAETFRGNLADTSLVIGFVGFPFPDGLVPGTTYYWRIDEIGADGALTNAGEVWSFLVPPRTAYNPEPLDGVKYALPDTQLNWTGGFEVKLHTVHFGDNFDDVNSAPPAGIPQVVTTYDPGPLAQDRVYYWRVDEFDGTATHKGDVWSFATVPDIAITNPNLMLWWTLDEGAGTTAVDWSGHGSHGAIVGGAKWVDGSQGTALTFGSDVYVEAAEYDGVTGTAPRTCCAWVKTTTTGNHNIMSWGQNVAGQKWRMRVEGAAGVLRVEVNGGSHYGVTSITDGRWHHVAVTFEDDGTPDVLDTLLYVDGQLDATGATTDEPINTGAGPVRIGESPWHNAPFLDQIDDARIYDKVLTAEELQQVMLGNTKLAGNPVPDRNALLDIRDISSLSWSRGDTAASHDVYFGTDRDAVAAADNSTLEFQGNQAGTSLSLANLVEFGGGDYYWRVDEVEADGTVNAGTIWKFTVPGYLIVDNFESYNNIDPPGEGNNRIFDNWIDGYGTTTNGSVVGHELPPYAETSIVRGGGQSMIYAYNNAGKTSEATLTLTARDWTPAGVTKLSLWIRGAAANAADRVYVALNGTAVIYHDDPAATQLAGWHEWPIDLSEFGVNLSNVNSISIGVGTKNAPSPAGGAGTMYFDEIVLIP